jgi:hypothetical protein
VTVTSGFLWLQEFPAVPAAVTEKPWLLEKERESTTKCSSKTDSINTADAANKIKHLTKYAAQMRVNIISARHN